MKTVHTEKKRKKKKKRRREWPNSFSDLNWYSQEFRPERVSIPTPTKQLHFRTIEYYLMIIVPTRKRHKSPFKHSKTIYVFTSGRAIITGHIHSREKLLNGLKWSLQNGPSISESIRRICSMLESIRICPHPAARFLMKREHLPVWGGWKCSQSWLCL